MRGLILDTSLAVEWFATDAAPDVLRKRELLDDHVVLVPHLWRFEVASVLTRWRKQGKISEAESVYLLKELMLLPFAIVDEGDPEAVMVLALTHDLSTYDATYLHVAMTTGEPLATLDRQLKRAAEAVGVTCL